MDSDWNSLCLFVSIPWLRPWRSPTAGWESNVCNDFPLTLHKCRVTCRSVNHISTVGKEQFQLNTDKCPSKTKTVKQNDLCFIIAFSYIFLQDFLHVMYSTQPWIHWPWMSWSRHGPPYTVVDCHGFGMALNALTISVQVSVWPWIHWPIRIMGDSGKNTNHQKHFIQISEPDFQSVKSLTTTKSWLNTFLV